MVVEKLNKSLIKPVAMAGALASIIQAIGWIVLSLLAIAYHFEFIEVEAEGLGYYIYSLFLDDDSCLTKVDVLITPRIFIIILLTYLITSFAWFLLSLYLLRRMILEKFQNISVVFSLFAAMLIIVSVADATLVGVLSYDYIKFEKWYDPTSTSKLSKTIFLIAYGIVLSIAGRGFVLWIANIIFAGIFIKFSRDTNECKNTGRPNREFISAYEPFGNNVPDLSSPGIDNPIYERSSSFYPVFNQTINEPGSRTSTLPRFAKRAIPILPPVVPRKIDDAPYIPEPDYSPPNTPNRKRLKGVLKNNTKY